MAGGDTFLADVESGLNTMVASARTTREFPTDVMLKVCDRQSLKEGKGQSWREVLAAQLTAQNYGETDTIDNPQQMSLSVLTATPQLSAVQFFIGKRVQVRLDPLAFGTFGRLAQEAMQRKKATDGLSLFSTATTTLGGTGVTGTTGHVRAGVRRIRSDATEPGPLPIHVVAHGYALYDIESEIQGGIGTQAIPDGYTADNFQQGFQGTISSARVWEDGLIAVDSTPDVVGGIFSWMAVLLVQGIAPWKESRDEPQKGYGGVTVWLKDEYIWAERSVGNWLFGWQTDGTAPTG